MNNSSDLYQLLLAVFSQDNNKTQYSFRWLFVTSNVSKLIVIPFVRAQDSNNSGDNEKRQNISKATTNCSSLHTRYKTDDTGFLLPMNLIHGHVIKVMTKSIDSSRKSVNYLFGKKVHFHTYKIKKERAQRVTMKNSFILRLFIISKLGAENLPLKARNV